MELWKVKTNSRCGEKISDMTDPLQQNQDRTTAVTLYYTQTVSTSTAEFQAIFGPTHSVVSFSEMKLEHNRIRIIWADKGFGFSNSVIVHCC